MARSSTTFQPGNKAAKGRPKKGESIAEIIREYLSESTLDATGTAVSRKRALVERLYSIAMVGEAASSVAAFKALVEHSDGKPQQTIVNHNIDVTALSDDELEKLAKDK